MISLFLMELRKLWCRRRFLMLVLLSLLLNLSLFIYTQNHQDIPLQAYAKLQQKLKDAPNEQRYDMIKRYNDKIQAFSILSQLQQLSGRTDQQSKDLSASLHSQYPNIETDYGEAFRSHQIYYTESLELEIMFMHEVYQEMNTLHNYPDMLNSIQQKAKDISTISIFSNTDAYSNRNIQKTANDFKSMQDANITFQLQKGIQEALHFPLTDILLVLMVCLIAILLILEEKNRNLFAIVRTCVNGQMKTIFVKCCVMILSAAILMILLYFSNLLYMQMSCGLGDLRSDLVSLAGYVQSTLHISIMQYLLLFLTTKWFAVGSIGALLMLIAIFSRYRIICISAGFAILGVELLCFLFIPINGSLSLFHYLNLISFLRTNVLYALYRNLNLFQNAISLQKLAVCCLLISFLMFYSLTCLAYVRKQNLQMSTLSIHLPFHRRPSKYLILQENYKFLKLQKGIFFLLFFVVFQYMSYQQKTLYISNEEINWMQYMETMEGHPTKEKEAILQKQKAHYDMLHIQYDTIQKSFEKGEITRIQREKMLFPIESQLSGENSFLQLKERYEYVKQDANRELLTPFGYTMLFTDEAISMYPALFALICFLLMLSNLQCQEYHHQIQRIITSTKHGGTALLVRKLLLALGYGLLIFIMAYLPDLLHIASAYGLPALNASITSIPEYADFPSSMSIATFLCINYTFKLLALELPVGVLFLCSQRMKQQLPVIFVMLLFFTVPLLLHIMDLNILDAVSLYPLFCNSILLLQNGFMHVITLLLGYGLLSVLSFGYVLRHRGI